MLNRNRNHPNALKHGAFARTAILPGEDPREFEELHSALIEEWAPVGPTEVEAVLSIAKGVWRKRRAQKLLHAEIEACRFNPKHPLFDEAHKLRKFLSIMETAPFLGFVDTAPPVFEAFYNTALTLFVSTYNANHLREKCPRQNFESGSAWLRALRKEVSSVLLPSFEIVGDAPEALLARSTTFFTPEVFKRELAVDERIDAMIDRAIKRLVQTKAMKQMLGRPSPNGGDDQPKKIHSGKPNGSAKVVNHKGRPGG
jgi:hypothetical protein